MLAREVILARRSWTWPWDLSYLFWLGSLLSSLPRAELTFETQATLKPAYFKNSRFHHHNLDTWFVSPKEPQAELTSSQRSLLWQVKHCCRSRVRHQGIGSQASRSWPWSRLEEPAWPPPLPPLRVDRQLRDCFPGYWFRVCCPAWPLTLASSATALVGQSLSQSSPHLHHIGHPHHQIPFL